MFAQSKGHAGRRTSTALLGTLIRRGSDDSLPAAARQGEKATASCDQTRHPRTHDWTRNKQRTAERGSYVARRRLEKANDIRVERQTRNRQERIAARNDAGAGPAGFAGSTIRSKRLCPQVCRVNGVAGNPPGAKTTNGIVRASGNPEEGSEVSTTKLSRVQSGGYVDSTSVGRSSRNGRVSPWHLRGSWLQNLDEQSAGLGAR